MRNDTHRKYDTYTHSAGSSRYISDVSPRAQKRPPQVHPQPIKAVRTSPLISDFAPQPKPPAPQVAKPAIHAKLEAPQPKPTPVHAKNLGQFGVIGHQIAEIKKKPIKKPRSQRLFYAFGIFVFVGSLGLNTYSFIINRQVKDDASQVASASSSVDEQGVEQGTGSNPSSDKPSDTAVRSYTVAADKPRYVRIPAKSVEARIKELGTTNTGAVDAPWNVHDVGWYNGSIKPGSKNGVSLLLGHVSGRTMPGVFKAINDLSVGEEVEVELGDGKILKYKVDKVEEYPLTSIDMAKILYEVEKGTQSLRLITCGGTFNSSTQSYDSRTVVYTSPIK